MTIAHIINTFSFILPCFALLLLTFGNHLRTPVLLHITGAILAYLVITFYGSGTYADYASFPLKYLAIGLSSIILGAVIFDMVTGYRLGHGIFIVAVTKCYTEHVTLLSMYIFSLLKKRLPAFNTFDASVIRIALTVITFPLIYYFSGDSYALPWTILLPFPYGIRCGLSLSVITCSIAFYFPGISLPRTLSRTALSILSHLSG